MIPHPPRPLPCWARGAVRHVAGVQGHAAFGLLSCTPARSVGRSNRVKGSRFAPASSPGPFASLRAAASGAALDPVSTYERRGRVKARAATAQRLGLDAEPQRPAWRQGAGQRAQPARTAPRGSRRRGRGVGQRPTVFRLGQGDAGQGCRGTPAAQGWRRQPVSAHFAFAHDTRQTPKGAGRQGRAGLAAASFRLTEGALSCFYPAGRNARVPSGRKGEGRTYANFVCVRPAGGRHSPASAGLSAFGNRR